MTALSPRVWRSLEWSRTDTIAATVVTAFAFLIRLARLGDPGSIIFDEVYYAKDSCWYVNVNSALCGIDYESTQVHPPLGKWLIALGIRLFGYDAFGWRIAAVFAGTAMVALLYLLARKLFRSTLGAIAASGLLAIDLLHFVQSRIAMLDIFVGLFALAAFLFVIYDRERLIAQDEEEIDPDVWEGPPRGLLDRPWRLAAGAAAGAATASKWTGGLVLLAVLVLTVVWEISARRRRGRATPVRLALREEGLSIFVWLMVAPLAVYLFTYIGRIEGDLLALPWADGSIVRALIDRHKYMLDFHTDLLSTHSYQSPAWSWILLKRPVSYAFCAGTSCNPATAEGNYKEIFATGNPFVWWPAVLALVYIAAVWVRKRDLRGPEGTILAGFVLTYGPWLLPMLDRPAVFIFYMVPTVPFLCLALAYVVTKMPYRDAPRLSLGVLTAFATIAFSSFVWYYPLVANGSVPQPEWDRRIWFFDDCDKPPGVLTTQTVTETTGTVVTTRTTETTDNSSLPPKGWCWI
ncbi:MAG TPA: phospholipid carrier-dependent glycosyltransferase [Actinomycetota bacterium]|nr:phospholipid carrier-dependent glycosyltransferase [Actinomycetota bacterium]